MTKMTYKEQLLHPNWQRKRLEMLERAGWKCECCDGEETTLHVHHKRYIKGRKAWEYENSELSVLCATCHQEEHTNRELLERLLSESDYGSSVVHVAIGLLGGYLDGTLSIPAEDLAESVLSTDGHSYDLGVLASIACGCGWAKMAEAAKLVAGRHLTPVQQNAIARWESEN
jgi:hypothetical protein